MLIVQINRGNNGAYGSEAGGRGTSGDSFWRTLSCCCNSVTLQQVIARVFGLQTFHSVVGRPNKQELYTV